MAGLVKPLIGTAVAGVFVAACDFPHPGNPHPPTDAGAGDAQSQPDADATPLPECLPPCLRDALSPCLPALDSCFSEREPPDAEFPAPYSDKICAADSTWSHETAYAFHSVIKTIKRNGNTCFGENTQWGSGFGPFTRYFDSSGAQVAFGAASNNGSGDVQVFCTSGTPSSGDVGYPLTRDCPLPTHRCQATTAGNCP
jgi:hypothetical protein